MPADLNEARRLYAEHLANDPRRFSMDAALARVVEWAFQKGIEEEQDRASGVMGWVRVLGEERIE